MNTYTGSCQCQAVEFEFDGEVESVMECNCSRCERTGMSLAFVPGDKFRIKKGEDSLANYQFNKKQINHLFCKTCGVQSFSTSTAPDGTQMVAVNLRTVDGINRKSLPVQEYDGKSL